MRIERMNSVYMKLRHYMPAKVAYKLTVLFTR